MKTYVVANLKGGVGKTTSAVNLAWCLSNNNNGKKVLVLDLDPQSNLTPFFAKSDPAGKTVREMLHNPEHMKSCIRRSRYDGIDIVRGSTKLREEDATVERLSAAIREITDRYDYCVIDTRPAFEGLTTAAFEVADVILTPVCMDRFCQDNLSLVEDYLTENGYLDTKKWIVFSTKLAPRKAQREIYKDLRQKHDYPFADTGIRLSSAVNNALNLYKPLAKHSINGQTTQDYEELAAEIIRITEEE